MRTAYYYQTTKSLQHLWDLNLEDLIIYLSSIHFGRINNVAYIHLNDQSADAQVHIWEEMNLAHLKGNKIRLMIGGAGGAFQALFSDFEIYYSLLKSTIDKFSCIDGIDLDVEETCTLGDIKMLIDRLISDFGLQFNITLSPTFENLTSSSTPFSYAELLRSESGSHIRWLNVQCYNNIDHNTIDCLLKNGFVQDELAITMLGNNYDTKQYLLNIYPLLSNFINKYTSLQGFVLWEYGDSKLNPGLWGATIKCLLV